MPAIRRRDGTSKPRDPDALVLESWAQGYMVGSLIIMAAITVANMRRGVLLHKLIFLELMLGTFMGFFMFTHPPVYGWFLSATAVPLNISWSLHNVIAWMKSKPFLTRNWSMFYIITVALVQPYWAVEIYANFTYFNNMNDWFLKTRPYEALFRYNLALAILSPLPQLTQPGSDPWWLFTTALLFYQIMTHYRTPLTILVVISPRFGVLTVSMFLSIVFIVLDIISVTGGFRNSLPEGLNPFWKLAFVFKCLCDSIVLDDFKTALDRLMRHKMRREGFHASGGGAGAAGYAQYAVGTGDGSGTQSGQRAALVRKMSTNEKEAMNGDPLSEDTMERRDTATSSMARAELAMVKTAQAKRETVELDQEFAKYLGPPTRGGAAVGMKPGLGHYEDVKLPAPSQNLLLKHGGRAPVHQPDQVD